MNSKTSIQPQQPLRLKSKQSISQGPRQYNFLSSNQQLKPPPYTLTKKDSTNIQAWLAHTNQRYQPQPTLSPAFEYYPLNYTIAFKKITIEESFLNRYLREINAVAGNGIRVLAGVRDQRTSEYLAKIYDRKGLFCHFDVSTRMIQLLQEIVLGFYTLDERVPTSVQLIHNNSQVPQLIAFNSPSLKHIYFILTIQLISNNGQIFQLGYIKLCLASRSKQVVTDMDLYRFGQKEKVGYIECQIDTPDRLGLSYFMPANSIVDNTTPIPPLKQLSLKNKLTPYSLNQAFPISISDLELTIYNYNNLLKLLSKCSPYFTQYHHQNLKMEVTKINFVVGLHNGWMMVTELPSVASGAIGNLQIREKLVSNSPTKNQSRMYNQSLADDKHMRQLKKNLSLNPDSTQPKQTHQVYTTSKLISPTSCQNVPVQVINFKLAENPNSKTESQNKIKKIASMQPNSLESIDTWKINMQYFDAERCQLIGVLQFYIKYSIDSTIKQQKTVKFNIFWVPITFDTAQTNSRIQTPMIEHINLPGYPISWNKVLPKDPSFSVSAQLSYNCTNNNPQLHKQTKKERLATHTLTHTHTHLYSTKTRLESEKDKDRDGYFQVMLDELERKERERDRDGDGDSGNLLRTVSNYDSTFRNKTQTSLLNTIKQQEFNFSIRQMLRKLQRTLPPKLTLNKQDIKNSTQILAHQQSIQPQPPKKPQGISLISNSYKITLHLREYLPVTTTPTSYYIPRKMQIQVFAFRQIHTIVAHINKDSNTVKPGIPLQLHNPNSMDYRGFDFTYELGNVTADDAGAYEDGNQVVVVVRDLENMMYYGAGGYPSIYLFRSNDDQVSNQGGLMIQSNVNDSKSRVDSQNSSGGDQYKFFRVQINSQQSKKGTNIIGYLLFQSQTTQLTQASMSHHPQQINFNKLLKQIPTKQRQKLRIQQFNGNDQADSTKRDLISRYKSNTIGKYVDDVANKELNNDLVVDYEIGKPAYGWVSLVNKDQSGNDVFTFEVLGADYLEIVTQKSVYNKYALAEAKKNQNGKWKNQPNLNYVLGKNGKAGYYQGKIPYNVQVDLLIRVLHNQWQYIFSSQLSKLPTNNTIANISITKIQVKRNTMPYRTIKLRLNMHKPLIDQIHHLNILWNNSSKSDSNSLKIKLPQHIFQQHGQNINSLTLNTSYNPKQKSIIMANLKPDSVGETGITALVLIGVYYDRMLQMLKRTLFLEIEVMQGQRVKLGLGELVRVKVPISAQNLKASQCIYRIQVSDETYLPYLNSISTNLRDLNQLTHKLSQQSHPKLYHYSQLQKSQPQLALRCMHPTTQNPVPVLQRKTSLLVPQSQKTTEELIVSLITLEHKLLKKYILEIECSLPHGCNVEEVEIEGVVGQKLIFMFQNPYHADFGFYIVRGHGCVVRFHDMEIEEFLEGERETYGHGHHPKLKQNQQQYIFKIRAKSHLKMSGQIVDNLRSNSQPQLQSIINSEQQHIVLCDCLHRVITIFVIRLKGWRNKDGGGGGNRYVQEYLQGGRVGKFGRVNYVDSIRESSDGDRDRHRQSKEASELSILPHFKRNLSKQIEKEKQTVKKDSQKNQNSNENQSHVHKNTNQSEGQQYKINIKGQQQQQYVYKKQYHI